MYCKSNVLVLVAIIIVVVATFFSLKEKAEIAETIEAANNNSNNRNNSEIEATLKKEEIKQYRSPYLAEEIWIQFLKEDFKNTDIERLLSEFDGAGGGGRYYREIIDYLESNHSYLDENTLLSLFEAVAYSFDWEKISGGETPSLKDQIISEFIRQQINTPYSSEILVSALSQSYKIAEGYERYNMVADAIREHKDLLSVGDIYKAKIRSSVFDAELFSKAIEEANEYTNNEKVKNEIYRMIPSINPDSDEIVKDSVNRYLDNIKLDTSVRYDRLAIGSGYSNLSPSEEDIFLYEDETINLNETISSFNSWINMKASVNMGQSSDDGFSSYINSYISSSNSTLEKIMALDYAFSEDGHYHYYKYKPSLNVRNNILVEYENADNMGSKNALKEILKNRFDYLVD